MGKPIILEKNNGIAKITMNNPGALNSLTPALLLEALATLNTLENDSEVKVVIITGAGRAFCAGGDLSHIRTLETLKEKHKYVEDAVNVTYKITQLPKPVIAMVNGVAAGAGFNLALACDIIFCAKSARFTQSFVKVGLIPDMGGTYFLSRAIGIYRAKELMFTADVIDADRAYDLGIVNRVVNDEKLPEETFQFAKRLAEGAPLSLMLIKKILEQGGKLGLRDALDIEMGGQVFCLGTDDHKEGVAAFTEKRAPIFKGI